MKVIHNADVKELNCLASNKSIGYQVRQSAIYKKVTNAQELSASAIIIKLTPEALLILAKIVSDSPLLKELYLSNNRLGAQSLKVVETIAESLSLEKVDLSHNKMGAAGLAVVQALVKLPSLNELNLRNNQLGPFVPNLAEILAKSPLKILHLSYNQLGADGPMIVKHLFNIPSLKKVTLDHAEPTIVEQFEYNNEGAAIIQEALDPLLVEHSLVDLVGEYSYHHIELALI